MQIIRTAFYFMQTMKNISVTFKMVEKIASQATQSTKHYITQYYIHGMLWCSEKKAKYLNSENNLFNKHIIYLCKKSQT